MDIARIREDLAYALEGYDFNVYWNSGAAPVLPAIMVGLPTQIVYKSMRDCQATFAIQIIVSMGDPEYGQELISRALTNRGAYPSVLDAIRTATSPYWKALVIAEVTNFGLVTDLNDALMCEVIVDMITNDPVIGS